jgi:type II secretory pathway pseudopilin PulG
MLQNNKGYLLIEAMFSLLLISVVFSICLPFIYISYQEQRTSEQLLYAMTEADHAAGMRSMSQLMPDERYWVDNGIEYKLLTRKGVTNEYETCISFRGSNQKEYKTCASSF